MGSSLFRSIQFSAYGLAFGASKDSAALCAEIPGTAGLQLRVVSSGVFSATCRSLIESPLEFIKVRRQTGQTWRVGATVEESLRNPLREIRSLYTGYSMTWARTVGLMTSFFCMVDHLERHHHDLVATPLLGPFIKGGVCASIGWVCVWPFENVSMTPTRFAAAVASQPTTCQHVTCTSTPDPCCFPRSSRTKCKRARRAFLVSAVTSGTCGANAADATSYPPHSAPLPQRLLEHLSGRVMSSSTAEEWWGSVSRQHPSRADQ